MTETETGQTAVNDPRTGDDSGTKLTQDRSGFDLKDTRRALIARRVKAGAETPIGHRCSKLLEQLENLSKSTNQDQRRNLAKNISRSIAELSALTKGT